MTITESELKKQIKEGRLQRVYFFYGEETYLVRPLRGAGRGKGGRGR